MSLEIFVVTHTHWDREWYQPVGRFRQRLVALIDELLDAPPAAGDAFLLDGQAIVLEDYLAVRPERRDRLAALLRAGTLEAGPWYVLADELIPGAEALVRNLLVGRRVLSLLGAAPPPVLYAPDSFGHPAALPELAAGFGLPLVIAWRGFGGARWPAGDLFEWRSPSGASALLFHLPRDGYELGSSLPTTDAAAADRWARLRAQLAPRSTTGLLLVQNGADHHARQRAHAEAVAALARAAAPDTLRAGGLRAFAEALLARARGRTLPRVRGELRDSYGYTWALQGTFATRAHQKRANARIERLLGREAEPWSALAARAGAPSLRPLVEAAWKALLVNHPHDTLCGCSIDAVATAMDTRLADARAQAAGVRGDALLALARHDPVEARERRGDWSPVVLLRNAAARPRGGVAIVELEEFVADVPVGPGSAAPAVPPRRRPSMLRVEGAGLVQPLATRWEQRRTESPRHYPDNDLVAVTRAAVWVDELPGYGTRAHALARGRARGAPPDDTVHVSERTLENAQLRVAVAADGRIALEHRATRRRIASLLTWEDRVDAGDLYTPAPRGVHARAELRGVRAVHRGPLRGALELRWRLVAARRRIATVGVRLTLDAGSGALRISIRGVNRGDDHRLRLVVRTDVASGECWADAAFGPVRRAPIEVAPEERAIETPPPTAPLHRYVSLFTAERGATLYSDGLAEYEATPSGEIAVTMLRAVGQLSRNDLPERPGHAGWPAPTPLAQSHGPFAAELALLLHGPRVDETLALVERTADDMLLPLVGTTLRSALALPAPTRGAELVGDGLAFAALRESDDGAWIVARCVNLLEREVRARWRFGFPVAEARHSRLDETPGDELAVQGSEVAFVAPPRGVVTILVR